MFYSSRAAPSRTISGNQKLERDERQTERAALMMFATKMACKQTVRAAYETIMDAKEGWGMSSSMRESSVYSRNGLLSPEH